MKHLIAAGVSAVALMAGAAHAATTTPQVFTFSDIGNPPGGFNETFNVQQFDPALGTLQKVTIFSEATVSGSQGGENESTSEATITLSTSVEIDLSFQADASILGTPGFSQNVVLADFDFLFQNVFNAAADDGNTNFDGPAGETFDIDPATQFTEVNSEDDTPIDGFVPFVTDEATFLAQFTGLGTVGIDLSTVGSTAAFGATDVSSNFATDLEGKLTVVYQFQRPPTGEIPVPAALPLLATGLGVLGFARFRRKS
ncbi:MAG: choice-of-anchor E domain-containing protein [Pseudomonadota bacterium]